MNLKGEYKMAQTINFEKEQTVWYTHAKGGNALKKGKITSFGPRFITVDNTIKFRRYSLTEVVSMGVPGQIFLSEDEYYILNELKDNLREINTKTSVGNPINLTVEQTREILKIIHQNSSEE